MGDFDKSSEKLQDAVQPFVQAQLEEMNVAVTTTTSEAGKVRIVGMVTGLIVIIITVFMARVTVMSITRPLGQMQSAISEVENNYDFSIKVPVNSMDEVGQTARAFNQLMGRVSEIIRQTRTSVEGIADASHELSQSTGQVTDGSRQQSEAAAAAATTTEEVSVSMSEMASRTQESESLSNINREETRQALSITQESMSGMTRTAQAIKESADNVARLSKSSDQISGIITVIKEIADQTNLLALNAAIEAARAGEQGRGFAVVADEVRKLAERTSRSTGEIGDLINAIQREIGQTVDTMRAADEQATHSVATAKQASEALEKIGTGGEQINERMREIANAIKEIDIAIQHISRQVETMAQMTEGNNAAAEISGNTARHLDELAVNLRQTVEKYRV
ncbi:MAG: methyl-accepting chemotaxis protein [Nitrosomonadales bacterium]|nr:methyl-accepting chemotaxis protein [Nitrosomonadales bacterium]